MAKRRRGFGRLIQKSAKASGTFLGVYHSTKEAVTRPHDFLIKKVSDRLVSYGNRSTVAGNYRNRKQFLNPKTGKWTKFDTKTHRIVGVKKDYTPYKRVRK
ncbi:MAG: hypothetical protein JRN68_03500 [Nitrososphaerota archaeon]|nr:hypothetical protein [Nitrososphaerota archaeon]